MSALNYKVSDIASIGNRRLGFGQKLNDRGIKTRTLLRLLACWVVALISVSVSLRADAWTFNFLAVGETWHALRTGRVLQHTATTTEKFTIARPPIVNGYSQGRNYPDFSHFSVTDCLSNPQKTFSVQCHKLTSAKTDVPDSSKFSADDKKYFDSIGSKVFDWCVSQTKLDTEPTVNCLPR